MNVLRHLANGRTHTALAHAVRAAEIEFYPIGASVFYTVQNRLPRRFFTRDHQRYDHGSVGPLAFDFTDLAQVDFQVAVSDQLNVIEPHQAAVWRQQRAVTRAVNVDDWRPGLAQRLPHHAAPTGFKRTVDVVGLVSRRRRSQPEGVGAFDACKINA